MVNFHSIPGTDSKFQIQKASREQAGTNGRYGNPAIRNKSSRGLFRLEDVYQLINKL